MAETVEVPGPVCHETQPVNRAHLKVETPEGQTGYFTFSSLDPEPLDFKAWKMKKAKPSFTVSVYDASCACPECERSIRVEHFAYRELVCAMDEGAVAEDAPETALAGACAVGESW